MKTRTISRKILSLLLAFAMVFSVFALLPGAKANAADDTYFTVYVANSTDAFDKAKVVKKYTKAEFAALCNTTEMRSLYFKDNGTGVVTSTTMRVHISTKHVGIADLINAADISTYWKDNAVIAGIEVKDQTTGELGIYSKFSLKYDSTGNDLNKYTKFYGDTIAVSPGVQVADNPTEITPSISIEGYREDINSGDSNTTKAKELSRTTAFGATPVLFVGATDANTPLAGNRFASDLKGIVLASSDISIVDLKADNLKNAGAALDKEYAGTGDSVVLTVTPDKNYGFKKAPAVTTAAAGIQIGAPVKNQDGSYEYEITGFTDDAPNVELTVAGEAVKGSAASADSADSSSGETPTGDEAMLAPFIILMIIAAGGTFALIRRRD